MNLWSQIKELLHPQPKRDPKVERVLTVTRQVQRRRERSHASLMACLAERVDEPEPRRRNGHAD